MEVGDGSVKTIALRGIKDNPPYLHEQRLLTMILSNSSIWSWATF